MGYGEKDDARKVMSAWEQALWPGPGSAKSFSYADFVMLPIEGLATIVVFLFFKNRNPCSDSHFVLDLFGFFEFLSALALGRLEGRAPQKEGFLKKSFSNVAVKERWKAHWSVCR